MQRERLDFLLHHLLAERGEDDARIPAGTGERRDLLRALMNVRPPLPLPDDVLEVQDAYLRERAVEKGIVGLDDIPTLCALGSRAPHADAISIWQGDITRLACDAIVNAANSRMLGCFSPLHGCIDNFIHTYAGMQLRATCDEHMRSKRREHGADYEQPTAVPLVTGAYNLPSRAVVHVVGPIVGGALAERDERDLRDCYTRSLDACAAGGLGSIAFCCISTGVFRFPRDRASTIAIDAVSSWLECNPDAMDRIVFNVYKDEDRILYERALL